MNDRSTVAELLQEAMDQMSERGRTAVRIPVCTRGGVRYDMDITIARINGAPCCRAAALLQ
jgi:hypothetical protein